MLQFPGATGRVKLVNGVELEGHLVTTLLVVLPHSIALVEAESNELKKLYDFQASDDHNTINDAVYVSSIRGLVVSFKDGSMTIIPSSCVDPKLLPRIVLKESLCSLFVVGNDAVIGWTASGIVCELPVYAGNLPEDPDAATIKGKGGTKSNEDGSLCIGCVLRNTGIVTANTENDEENATSIRYNYVNYSHTNSETLLASRLQLRWMSTETKMVSTAALDASNWRILSICADTTTHNAVLFLASGVSNSGPPAKSKKKSKGDSAITEETVYYILKVDVVTNMVLLSRKVSPPGSGADDIHATDKAARKRARSMSDTDITADLNVRPVHLLSTSTVVWIVWSTGLCAAYNSRHGVPIVFPLRFCAESVVDVALDRKTASCRIPGNCSAVLNHEGCRDHYKFPTATESTEGTIVSIAVEALNSDKNSFLFYALKSSQSLLSLWHSVTSLLETHNSELNQTKISYKPTSLCAALGSLVSKKSDLVPVVADVSGGVLNGLPRNYKRRLNTAQIMLAEELNCTVNSGIVTVAESAPPQTPETAKKTKKNNYGTPHAAATGTVHANITDESMQNSYFQYIGIGKQRSAVKKYLDNNMDAVEAFVHQLDLAMASADGCSMLKSSDWSVFQAVLRTETLSIQKRPFLLTTLFALQRIDVLADVAEYVPDLSEGQAVAILMYCLSSPESFADRYCLRNGRLKARNKLDTSFFQEENIAEFATPQTPIVIDKSAKKSAKKANKFAESISATNSASSDWQPSGHEVKSIILSIIARALLKRNCAYSVPTLISAAREIRQDAASALLNTFTAIIGGQLSIGNSTLNDQLTENFNDRQVSMALNWIEALLDSHYSGFAMSLANRLSNSDKQAHTSKITASVLRKLFTMTTAADLVLYELEAMFGLWTHISRSSTSGFVTGRTIGTNSAFTMGGSGGAVYQIEKLEL